MEDELHVLGFHTGTYWDACWHHAIEIDPVEQAQARRRQILQLARYGRFGGIHEWDDETVRELRAWWETLKELLDKEDALQKAVEGG